MRKKPKVQQESVVQRLFAMERQLDDEMEALKNGNSSPQRLRAVATAAHARCHCIDTAISYHKFVIALPKTDSPTTPLLGR